VGRDKLSSVCYDGYIMMVRTQITLDPQIHKRARQRAAELGISLAEYMRRLVTKDLGETPRVTDPSVIFNLGSSSGSDVAREKDRMVGEAVDAEHRQRRLGR
jgi:hypothetical protein